jgi:hypothetical protein
MLLLSCMYQWVQAQQLMHLQYKIGNSLDKSMGMDPRYNMDIWPLDYNRCVQQLALRLALRLVLKLALRLVLIPESRYHHTLRDFYSLRT